MAIVKFDNVTKAYKTGEHELKALDHVSFTLDEGKSVSYSVHRVRANQHFCAL